MEGKDIIRACDEMVKETISKHGGTEEKAVKHVIEILEKMTKDNKFGLNDFRIALNYFGFEAIGEWKEPFEILKKKVLQQYGINNIFEKNLKKGYSFEEIKEALKENIYSSFQSGELNLFDMDICLWALGYDIDSKFYFLTEEEQKKNLLLAE